MIFTDCSKIVLAGQYGAETRIAKIFLGDRYNILYPTMDGKDYKISVPKNRETGATYCIGNEYGFINQFYHLPITSSSSQVGTRTTGYTSYDEILKIKPQYDYVDKNNLNILYTADDNIKIGEFYFDDYMEGFVLKYDANDYWAHFYCNSLSDNVILNEGETYYQIMYLYKIEKI